jgi:hypothetical protein
MWPIQSVRLSALFQQAGSNSAANWGGELTKEGPPSTGTHQPARRPLAALISADHGSSLKQSHSWFGSLTV